MHSVFFFCFWVANASKSAVYTAGVDNLTRRAFCDLTQLSLGGLPFRYLGVPLSSRRLSIAECESLANKMTSRIRSWSAKNLSYAARLQLINSVVIGISAYRCQIFILPKRLLDASTLFVDPFYGLVFLSLINLVWSIGRMFVNLKKWEV